MTACDISILIADDDSIVCDGLAHLLESQPGIHVVATASNGLQVFDILNNHTIDVALIDVDMPVLSGIEVAQKMAIRYPNIKIIMLTAFEYEESLGQALSAGVQGFLTKDISIPELAMNIRKAYAGQRVMGQRPIEILTDAYREKQQDKEIYADFIAAVEALPSHLRPTFNLMLKALSNKSISRELKLTEATVRSYVSDILSYTGCTTRGELAITAIKAGIKA